MKKVIIVVQWLLTLMLISTLFLGLMTLASSHKIPLKTNIAIGVSALTIAMLLVLTEIAKRKLQ